MAGLFSVKYLLYGNIYEFLNAISFLVIDDAPSIIKVPYSSLLFSKQVNLISRHLTSANIFPKTSIPIKNQEMFL